jgi:N6-L-threonylcarbamoyladenine synthase
MKILSIETSCDETAVSVVEATGVLPHPTFTVLGNSLFSQIDIHREYGGVFPMMAKRAHAQRLVPLLIKTLTEAGIYQTGTPSYTWDTIPEILSREEGLLDAMRHELSAVMRPDIDAIAVTYGPGLEPALWVGISFARALSALWGIPLIPTNHMEGHIYSILLGKTPETEQIAFPALALLISGGHTEIVEMTDWGKYAVIGQTRDDAVGEAFDKVARMLSLPYPRGPEISKLAETARTQGIPKVVTLPRPMIHSHDYDFSFSGLKTSVLYYIRDNPITDDIQKMDIAREFEDAVVEVLLTKTKQALLDTGSQTLIIAGGVIANRKIRDTFATLETELPGVHVKTPTMGASTDNALMIACASYISVLLDPTILTTPQTIVAQGNLSFPRPTRD